MTFSSMVKVSATVTITATTAGNSFYGTPGFGAGTATYFTPYSSGTNYATLSQWGDFRLSRIDLQPICDIAGSTADSIQVVAALDSTGADIVGGTGVTGAYNTIRSRQSARFVALSNAVVKGPRWRFKPVELQDRLWQPQAALSGSTGAATGQNWGVLVSANSATSSTVTLNIDWYFEVREPTLSGVLLGKESIEEKARLQRQEAQVAQARASVRQILASRP